MLPMHERLLPEFINQYAVLLKYHAYQPVPVNMTQKELEKIFKELIPGAKLVSFQKFFIQKPSDEGLTCYGIGDVLLMPEVSVMIPTTIGGFVYLAALMPQLREEVKVSDAEIIIVDNASVMVQPTFYRIMIAQLKLILPT
jgi:hypothetical protein